MIKIDYEQIKNNLSKIYKKNINIPIIDLKNILLDYLLISRDLSTIFIQIKLKLGVAIVERLGLPIRRIIESKVRRFRKRNAQRHGSMDQHELDDRRA